VRAAGKERLVGVLVIHPHDGHCISPDGRTMAEAEVADPRGSRLRPAFCKTPGKPAMSSTPHRPPAVIPPLRRRPAADALSGIRAVTLTSALMAGLYFGRDVLIPLSLAALITFLLSPLVSMLERWLGKVVAVLLAMSLLLGGAVSLGWAVAHQAIDLANELPGYKENIRSKLRAFQLPEGGPIDRLTETMADLKRELPGDGKEKESGLGGPGEEIPVPVAVVDDATDSTLGTLRLVAAPVLGPLGTTALVVLLATFMLLKREDLQGRVIRLIGQGRISATTRAMDEAGSRVRRYLLMQLVINVTYGIPLAIGLYFIGVPNALLWGALAAALRFIPYIGPWIAAAFPILLSLAVSPSWATPLLTLGLFIVLELVSNNVMEPWLYGSSTGVSPIALIVAAVFWTWLWGPVGLVLAAPFTVCLVVMGRHIPQLSFLSVVLSEEEALTPAEDFYHRLLKQGESDETELAESILKSKPLTELYDAILIPVLRASEEDHLAGATDADQRARVLKALGELVEDLGERYLPLADEAAETGEQTACRVQCVAARAERDEIAGAMAAHVLHQQGFEAVKVSGIRITTELIRSLQDHPADVVCISVVEPTKAIHARNLCQRIRRALPEQRIVAGLWGRRDDLAEDTKMLTEAGVSEVVASTTDLAESVERLASRLAEQAGPPGLPADEEERMIALDRLGLTNDEREPVLDRITAKLARVFEAPVTAITLIDRERQWFKAHTGLPEDLAAEGPVPRDLSICAHVVAANRPVLVRDLKRDRRFMDSPMLLKHGIRFYAGVPVRAANGQPLGALCVMDTTPRGFSKRELKVLEEKAEEAAEELERIADITPGP
jgi:predicted PurR-regulated permease PerM/GAF domain-containing protein